ncbi:MAG TPA: ABC transporter ATP-binding protein [Candidatus Saccharimonadales bacterium]
MSNNEKKRDKEVTNYTHRLFWDAMFKPGLTHFFLALLHSPSFFLTNIVIPIEIAYAVQAIIERNFSAVPKYALYILIIAIVANIILAFATWGFNRNGTNGGKYIQNVVFHNYLSKDFEFYSNNFIGALGNQASSLRIAFLDYNRTMLFDAPRAAVIVIAGMAVLAFKSPELALITGGCMLTVFSFTFITSTYRLRYRRGVSEANSEVSSVLGDALSHATVVKSFDNEAYEAKRLAKSLGNWKSAQLKSWDLFTPTNAGRNGLLAVSMAILLIVSANLYKNGAISIAIITLVQLYVIRLINTTLDIAETIKNYDALMGMAYQPVATMMIEPEVVDPNEPQKLARQTVGDINFEKVSYVYPEMKKGNHAISNFSYLVKGGSKIGVVGYSGSGKTTLTKLLLRFMDVESGSIKISGVDIRNLKQSNLRDCIAYVPQEPLLFHRSIKDNIAYARPEATEQEVLAAAKLAYVDEFVKDLPKGYDTMVGERGVKLSGGQRQRVAIARALLKGAPILVLDEATSALDSQSEYYIQKALSELMKERTSIVIAHRLSTIQKMDEIIVMDDGIIVQTGTHKQLLDDKKSIYAKLWGHQSGGYIEE